MVPVGKSGKAEIIEIFMIVGNRDVDSLGFIRDGIDHEYYLTNSEAKAEQTKRIERDQGNTSIRWWVKSRYAIRFEDGEIYLLAHARVNRSVMPSLPVKIIKFEG